MILSSILGVVAFWEVAIGGQPRTIEVLTWVVSGSFEAHWALRWDTLTAVMVLVVTVVSTTVHVYSVGYMSHDHRSEEHTSELQSLMRISYAVFCLKKKKKPKK